MQVPILACLHTGFITSDKSLKNPGASISLSPKREPQVADLANGEHHLNEVMAMAVLDNL